MIKLSKHTLLLYSTIAFIIGIALYPYLPFLPTHFLITGIGLLLTTMTLKRLIPKTYNLKPLLTFILLIISLSLLGLSRGQFSTHKTTEQTIDFYNDTEVRYNITGVIIEEPDIRRDKINYTLEVTTISSGNPSFGSFLSAEEQSDEVERKKPSGEPHVAGAKKVSRAAPRKPEKQITGKLLISAPKFPEYNYGDIITVTGEPITPAVFDTFDYAAYLSRYQIYSVLYRPRIKLIKEDEGSYFWSALLWMKTKFNNSMQKVFPTEPYNSFMAGLLLGSRKGIPEDLTEAFRVTGLTHIIAISGYNITIIVTIFMALLLPIIGRKKSIYISAVGIVLFTLFVGASPAVVRACIMGIFALIALHSQRKGQITTVLVLTVAIMIGWNPKILYYDIGFQLSFLATMGLIYVSPTIEPYLMWLPEKLALRESFVLTLSAQVLALPIILLNFQNLSLISPFANLMVAGPIIPFTMLFGFIATVIGWIFLPLAKFIGFPAYLLLNYQAWMIETLSKVPYASVEVTWFTTPLLIIYFIIITIYLIHYWKNKKNQPTDKNLSTAKIN